MSTDWVSQALDVASWLHGKGLKLRCSGRNKEGQEFLDQAEKLQMAIVGSLWPPVGPCDPLADLKAQRERDRKATVELTLMEDVGKWIDLAPLPHPWDFLPVLPLADLLSDDFYAGLRQLPEPKPAPEPEQETWRDRPPLL